MPRNVPSKLLMLSFCAVVLAAFIGCQTDGVSTKALAEPPPPAPAYTFHYYPQVNIYYDVERDLYFYPEGGQWKVAKSLPHGVGLAGDFLVVDLRVGAPAAFNPPPQESAPSAEAPKQTEAPNETALPEPESEVVVVRIDQMLEEQP
jgi:hypothetical protein